MDQNLKKQIWIVAGALIIAASFFLFFFDTTIVRASKLSINGTSFNIEVAQTAEERALGLSGHEPLADNEGMLFIFSQPGYHGFWMKDMLFPIDIIWLSADKKIVHIEHQSSPDTYPQVFSPDGPAQYVFEVNAGLAEKYNWREGDQAQF